MARAIRITAGSVSAEARLNDSKTAVAIWDALPIEAKGQTWGDEIYFDIGLTARPRERRARSLTSGTSRTGPRASAFCIFFGPTPASRGDECRAASAVNVVGKLAGRPRGLQDGAFGDARNDRAAMSRL